MKRWNKRLSVLNVMLNLFDCSFRKLVLVKDVPTRQNRKSERPCGPESSSGRRVGFTLAEVLITLGIIGIVAAITVPILMQNTQDKQFKEAAREAFSKASQAIQQMRLDEGGNLNAYYGTNDNKFKNAFIQYFKVAKDCGDWAGCVPYSAASNIYYTYKGEPATTWMFDEGQFITTDGVFFGFSVGVSNGIVISVDVNGYGKAPNIFGRDTFFFELINDTLLPMGAIGTLTYRTDNYYCSKTYSDTLSGLSCMEYVMEGKDY